MAKAKVRTHFSIIDQLRKLTKDKAKAEVAGASVLAHVKGHIKRGVSPVKGEGKFKQYAKIRTHPKKYPDGITGKNTQPVNLKLSGKMLDHLTHWINRKDLKMSFTVGINKNAPEKIKKMAEAHNDGTLVNKNVPQRKFIPNKKGDKFTVSIDRKIKELLFGYVEDTIKKSNKK